MMQQYRIGQAVLVSLATLLGPPVQVRAQAPYVVRGLVVDAVSSAPVYGAFVAQVSSSRGVLTDSLGLFALEVTGDDALAIRVSHLGYHDLHEQFDPARGGLVTLSLTPNPIELNGLTVLADRFAERRRGPFGAGVILDQSQLLRDSGGSGYDLVRRMLPFVQPCDVQSEELCLGGRNAAGRKRVVRVCLDDHRVPGHVMETALSGVDPRGLYVVEVYSRVGEVRMYTPGFIKQLAELGTELRPLTFGCADEPFGIR